MGASLAEFWPGPRRSAVEHKIGELNRVTGGKGVKAWGGLVLVMHIAGSLPAGRGCGGGCERSEAGLHVPG